MQATELPAPMIDLDHPRDTWERQFASDIDFICAVARWSCQQPLQHPTRAPEFVGRENHLGFAYHTTTTGWGNNEIRALYLSRFRALSWVRETSSYSASCSSSLKMSIDSQSLAIVIGLASWASARYMLFRPLIS